VIFSAWKSSIWIVPWTACSLLFLSGRIRLPILSWLHVFFPRSCR
jgi:hypothetical protein